MTKRSLSCVGDRYYLLGHQAMITQEQHPVSWAMLLYELTDAEEHLGSLVEQMTESGQIDEVEFRVQLGHVFTHLNRAWHGRNDPNLDQSSQELHAERSRFPADLVPVG